MSTNLPELLRRQSAVLSVPGPASETAAVVIVGTLSTSFSGSPPGLNRNLLHYHH
jgi:hypothetical protein